MHTTDTAFDLTCRGRLVDVPPGRGDWIYLTLEKAPDTEVDEEVWLHYRDAVDPEWFRVPAGERVVRLPVTRQAPLVSLRLPRRPGLRPTGIGWTCPRDATAGTLR